MSSSLVNSYSAFQADGNEPTFQQKTQGPWGIDMKTMMEKTAASNTTFDPLQFEEAKQNGYLKPPQQTYPIWPPPSGTGFIYPTITKMEMEGAMGDEKGVFKMAPPFAPQPVLYPSTQSSTVEYFHGKKLTPEELLNGQLLSLYPDYMTPDTCTQRMPYDSSFQSESLMVQDPVTNIPLSKPVPQPIPHVPSTQPIPHAPSTQPIPHTPHIPSTQPIPHTPSTQPIPHTPSTQPIPHAPSTQPIPHIPHKTPQPISKRNALLSNASLNVSSNNPSNTRQPLVIVDMSDPYQNLRNNFDFKLDQNVFPTMVRCVKDTVRGLVKCESVTSYTQEVLTQKDRIYYLLLFLFWLCMFYYLIFILVSSNVDSNSSSSLSSTTSNNQNSLGSYFLILYWVWIIVLLVHWGTPQDDSDMDNQKFISLIVIAAILVWMF
jgi:hypothetical protein